MIKITEKPIDVQKVIDTATSLGAGAVNVFIGTVRNSAHGKNVLWLEYEEGPPGGVSVKYTRKFLDYRVVQQTLAPYRIVLLENGRESQVTNVLTITYGVKVSDSIFKNPQG